MDGDIILTANEVESLMVKANGGKRLVVAYMSIGEAEDYRYYWKDEWGKNAPDWLRQVVDKKYVKLEKRDNCDILVLQLRAHEIRNRIAHISSAP